MTEIGERIIARDIRALARVATSIENRRPEAEALLTELFPHTGRALVLGITGAISGVKSDDLELGSVTGGLAYAFDATALALGITMITMFCSFLTERVEGGVLEEVDRFIDRELAHRFQRVDADLGPLSEGLRQNAAARIILVLPCTLPLHLPIQ